MNILYIGDIMGQPGIDTVKRVLPVIRKQKQIDLVIAQAENVTDGKGLSKADFNTLKGIGVDFCTGGNWTLHRPELNDYLADPNRPVIRPANYPPGTVGRGWKYAQTKHGPVLIISLLGQIVGKDSGKLVDNPLRVVDQILKENKDVTRTATIVNFHGDYSSEKRVVGYFLDGRASAVIGDHWHVPTADAMILPKGTAHITDVGMCGALHSSLGVKTQVIINRWHDDLVSRNELETNGPFQFNAAVIEVSNQTGLATKFEQIQKILS